MVSKESAGSIFPGTYELVKEFHVRDHLGNTRIVLEETIDENYIPTHIADYYPFGMEIRKGGTFNPTPPAGNLLNNRYLYNGKEFQDDFGLDWYDYGARFYDAQIARFHSVDLLAEVYSYQSPFAYAANNPIYYIDYMGLGPKEWWESFKGWVNTRILGKTASGNFSTVKPEREERTVVFAKENYVTPPLNLDWAAYFRGEQLREPDWGGEINYYSSFDYSNRKNVRGQGVLFNYQEQGRQVWQERSFFKGQRILLSPDDRFQVRVDAAVRRFLGLNMGNRMHISFHGRNPDRPIPTAADIQYHRDTGLAPVYHWPRTYYQMILRLHGTRAYFQELQRAGIIESFQ
ncbi:MAG: RHS repeat domain-containing protein [Bacteroidota bacterium]